MKTPALFLILLILLSQTTEAQRRKAVPNAFLNKDQKEGIYLGELAQNEQFSTLIRYLENKREEGEILNMEQLFWLCTSYSALCNYDMLYQRIELLEAKIRAGDALFAGNDMAVYPYIYRADYYQAISHFQRAIEEARKGYALLHRDGRPGQYFYRTQLINLLGILGTSLALTGDKTGSREALEELEGISLEVSNLGPEKYTTIARIHMANRDFPKALEAITDPRATVEAELSQYYNTTFQDLPKLFIYYKCLFELGRSGEAARGYDILLEHVNIEQMGSTYWILLLDRAIMYREQHELEQAVDLLKRAVDHVEEIRSSIRTEAGRIGFVENKQRIYQELITLLMQMGRYEEAFFYVERSKARTLVDLLGSVPAFRIDKRSLQSAEELLSSCDRAESEVLMSRNMGDTAALQRSIGFWRAQKKELLEEAPELENLVSIQPVDLATIQSRLREGEQILEYYYTPGHLYAFVITGSSLHACIREISGPALEEKIHTFRAALSDPGSDAYLSTAIELYDLLIRPLEGQLNSGSLRIVPHGALHYLPFAALHSGQDFLVDRFSLCYLPSAEVLRFLKDKGLTREEGGLILGNPDLGDPSYALEYAEKEARQIAGLLPGATLLTDSEATETIVKKEGAGFPLLHLASHGIFYPGDPLKSSLLLAPDDENDGWLTATELYSLKLNAQLVTLSACESGLAEIASGDDLIGFTRGLLYAGARSIVSSLWQVDDRSTSALMVTFYGKLAHMEKQDALRQAQIETREQFRHPFYWAPFIITGKGD